MQLWGSLLIFIFTAAVSTADAAKYRRLVNFEWEAIANAKSYEIELTQTKLDEDEKGPGAKLKVYNFKVDKAAWNGRLTPGKYIMRLRSRDHRNVPGEWSPPSDFDVGLDNVVISKPAAQQTIATAENEKVTLDLQWQPVGGADFYHLIVQGADGKTLFDEKISETQKKMEFPVAAQYRWSVQAGNKDGILSDAVTVSQFSVQGKAVAEPALQKPENEFVRQLQWSRPAHVTGFDVSISKLNPETKKYEKFKVLQNYQEETLDFDSQWPGGRYRVALRARGNMRPTSKTSSMNFQVKAGDRSPAAEYTALVRKSIDRVTGWYGIASYLVTEIKFSSSNREQNSAVAYNAVGGTGRVGAGWFSASSPWGFLGIVDMSGFAFEGKTQTFASAELNAIYRYSLGERSEIRWQVGPYYKELPETIVNPFTGASQDSKVSAAGPHFGGELWYSLTPKLGIQLNAHLYASVLKMSTPNGQELMPSLSTQFGLMGSYRFTRNFTGLMGYAMREDRMSYKALPTSDNFATAGDVNESTVVGTYLNFFAEWGF